MRLEEIAEIALPLKAAARLRRGGSLKLVRAWPRSSDHLLLEYIDEENRITPGQWMRDTDTLHGVAGETASRGDAGIAATSVVPALAGAVLLQTGGADRRLKGLAKALARPGTKLVSHRPERRAVVRSEINGEVRFGKVVRRSRLEALVMAHELVVQLDGRPFDVPEIIETDPRGGVVWFRALEGRCLHDDGDDREIACDVGRTLRWLHEADGTGANAIHDAAAEAELLTRQFDRLSVFAPDIAARVAAAVPACLSALAGGTSPSGLLHRDFYDKQIFVDAGGRIALLDLDTLARGETALDIANMLAHIELRALQGSGEAYARAASEAFLRGYDPSARVRDRIPAYLTASRLRLACVYAYRPAHASVVSAVVERVGG